MKKKLIGVFSIALSELVLGGQAMVSSTFDLDTAPAYTACAPYIINYSPMWVDGIDGTGAACVIYAVSHAGTEQPMTTLVYRASANTKGEYVYMPTQDTHGSIRLVLGIERDGQALGWVDKDIAFSVSAMLENVSVDARTNAVQEFVNTIGKIPIAYDGSWQNGASSSKIECVYRTREGRGPVTVVTNEVAMIDGLGVLEWPVPNKDGNYHLCLMFVDGFGNVIGETIESPWFEKYVPRGLVLNIR